MEEIKARARESIAMEQDDSILVVAADAVQTRALPGARSMNVTVLTENVSLFLQQIERMVAKAPESVGGFHFVELEVHAEVSAKGSLALLGTGGEAGATGGLKFVFRRETSKQ
jgi:hypothetical protein